MKSKLKTKLKKALFTFMAVFMSLSGVNIPTHAADNSLTKQFYNDINYQMSKGGYTAWGAGFNLAMNGKHVFCVDPTMDAVSGSGYTSSDFSHAQANKMSIISYEGYYKHRNDSDIKNWNMATQLMIWETMGWSVTSVTGFDYASYKTNIQNAINKHSTRPSFNGDEITIKVGESITTTPTDKTLPAPSIFQRRTDNSPNKSMENKNIIPKIIKKFLIIVLEPVSSIKKQERRMSQNYMWMIHYQ